MFTDRGRRNQKTVFQKRMPFHWHNSAAIYGEVQQMASQVLGCAWLHLKLQLCLRDSRITFVFAVMPVGMGSGLPFWNKEFLQRKLHVGKSTPILMEPRTYFLTGMESSYIIYLPAPSTVLPYPPLRSIKQTLKN